MNRPEKIATLAAIASKTGPTLPRAPRPMPNNPNRQCSHSAVAGGSQTRYAEAEAVATPKHAEVSQKANRTLRRECEQNRTHSHETGCRDLHMTSAWKNDPNNKSIELIVY